LYILVYTCDGYCPNSNYTSSALLDYNARIQITAVTFCGRSVSAGTCC